jgi:hypothetical protein
MIMESCIWTNRHSRTVEDELFRYLLTDLALKSYTLLIVFIYKINDPRSKHLDPIFNQIASEIGVKNNLYPFAKVASGIDKPEIVKELPNIVVYHYGKVLARYIGLAEEYKVMDWLATSLKKVIYSS